MRLKSFLVVCFLLCFLVGSALAAVTGKISGVLTDAKTGDPIIGASIAVQGTALGATSDVDGKYIVLNVPVGTYTVLISSVGYSSLNVENVYVSTDLATKEDHALEAEVTELNKTITVSSSRPLVLSDKTTTIDVMTSEEFEALPIRGFESAITLQNSVVRMKLNNDSNVRLRGNRESTSSGGELNLRGGRPSEVAYYVDGFSQQDPLSGISSSSLANNAIKEISVQSGTFSSEYGHVASGVVNVVTKSGTPEYHGTLDMVTDNLLPDSYDQNFYSADLGGPLPGFKNAFFFLSGERRYLGDRSPSSKTKEFFEIAGLDEEYGVRLPSNSLDGWSAQAKFDFDLSPKMKLTANGNWSKDNWQEYRHNYLLNSEHSPRYLDKNFGANLKFTHMMDANTYYNLSASYFVTERFRGDGVMFDDLAAYNRGFADPEWDFLTLFSDPNGAIIVDGDTVGYAESLYANYLKRKSSYIGIKGDFNKQLGTVHTFKSGVDFQRHTLRYYENLDATFTGGYVSSNINRYGYDSLGNESDNEDWKNDTKHPINLGLYLQDRIDWGGFIINAGLRFDMFDYKSLRIKDLENPLDPGNLTGIDTLDAGDFEDSKVFTRLSPRLGIGFPVSDKTQFHINYGKFFQRPDLVHLYTGYDFLAERIGAGSYYAFPSPNLEPEKVTQYEAGVTHQIGLNTALSITAYYKDVEDLTQIFHQSPASPFVYDFYSNTDFGTIKGIDFEVAMRRTNNLRMDLKYTVSWATGTGSYAQSQFNVAWQNPDQPPKVTNYLDFDRRHSMSAIIDFRTSKGEGPKVGNFFILENLSVNSIVQLASGTPYTPLNRFDAATEAAVNPEPSGPVNTYRLPWTFNINLKIERQFTYGDWNITPYIWIENLLDAENLTAVYESSGKGDVTGWLDTDEGRTWAESNSSYDAKNLYELKERNPRNYGPPRMIMFGVKTTF